MVNEPQIRLDGFTGEWEQRKLGDIADIFDGTHQTPNYVSDGIMFLSVENINTLTSKKFISEIDYIRDFKVVPEYGDVLMTRIGDIGTTNVIRTHEKLAYYVSLALLKPKNSDSDFLAASIHSPPTQKELWKKMLHVAFPKKINLGEIQNISIKVPGIEEQKALGNFFRTLDENITLNKQKLESLKQLKKGYLQQMFPQAGETSPHVRFEGFTEPWNIRTLGEISEINTGASDVQDADPNGEFPFFIRSKKVERSSKYLFDGEAILIPGEGRIGDIYHYINGKFDFHQRVYKISDFENNVNGKFILYAMQKTFKQHAMTYTAKATVDSLRLPILTGFNIQLPSHEEQTAISNFFHNLDNQIITQTKKVEQLKQLKIAYLQNMFV